MKYNTQEVPFWKMTEWNWEKSFVSSAATSINSLATDMGPAVGHVPDSLDTKIDCLLRDWHHNADLLFSIHPIDGSFLIW